MSSDDLKKIKRIADIGADVHNALFEHIEENEAQHSQIIEKVDGLETDLVDTQQAVISLQEELKTIELTPGEKGEQGIQGKQGIKGEKGDKGDKGDRGEKGEDGYNGIDGLDGKNGENGKDGKDGSPDTGEQIVEKINKQKTQIDASKIKNLPQPVINQIFEGKGGAVGLETIKQDGVIKSQSTKSLNFVGSVVTKDNDNITVTTTASTVPNTPAGNISSTTVQDAINELDFATSVASNHASLTNLAWTSSNHTGTVSKLAGFDASGVASEYTEADYIKVDGTRPFTGNVDVGANDLKVDTNTLFVDASENAVGFGTATPAQPIHIYKDDNSDALVRIDNPNSGTLARAGIQFRNGNLGTSEQFALVIGGTGYTGVTSWQDAGVMFSSSGLSGGFHYAAYTGGIHFQTGGYGTGYDRLKVEDALITSNVKLKFLGGILGRQTTVSAATHSLAANNVYLRVTRTTTGACTITLTTAESELGRLVIIKDAGKAGTNNITIDTEGSQLIEGSASIAIAVDKGYVALWFNGTNWDILFDKLT